MLEMHGAVQDSHEKLTAEARRLRHIGQPVCESPDGASSGMRLPPKTSVAKSPTSRLAQILTRELDSVGIRLNRSPPNITLTRKKTGGIHVSKSPSVTLTHVDEQMVKRILAVRIAAPRCCS